MVLYVWAMALSYLGLQVGALFLPQPVWQRAARLPVWTFGVATIAAVVAGAMGYMAGPLVLALILPMTVLYLLTLWALFAWSHYSAARHDAV